LFWKLILFFNSRINSPIVNEMSTTYVRSLNKIKFYFEFSLISLLDHKENPIAGIGEGWVTARPGRGGICPGNWREQSPTNSTWGYSILFSLFIACIILLCVGWSDSCWSGPTNAWKGWRLWWVFCAIGLVNAVTFRKHP
jgi:hypothetical protein